MLVRDRAAVPLRDWWILPAGAGGAERSEEEEEEGQGIEAVELTISIFTITRLWMDGCSSVFRCDTRICRNLR